MRTFEIPTNPYEDRVRLFTKKTVEFKPGITCLVGCNGSGKTTLLHLIRDQLENEKDILCLSYDDRSQGGSNLMSKFGFQQRLEDLAGMVMRSEGERIHRGFGEFIGGILRQILNKNPKEVWLLIDAVGSGLSIDNILEIIDFFEFMRGEHTERDLYFVVSTNEYEFARNQDCIDVTTFGHKKFTDYEKYKAYILKTREKKDKRYKHV